MYVKRTGAKTYTNLPTRVLNIQNHLIRTEIITLCRHVPTGPCLFTCQQMSPSFLVSFPPFFLTRLEQARRTKRRTCPSQKGPVGVIVALRLVQEVLKTGHLRSAPETKTDRRPGRRPDTSVGRRRWMPMATSKGAGKAEEPFGRVKSDVCVLFFFKGGRTKAEHGKTVANQRVEPAQVDWAGPFQSKHQLGLRSHKDRVRPAARHFLSGRTWNCSTIRASEHESQNGG